MDWIPSSIRSRFDRHRLKQFVNATVYAGRAVARNTHTRTRPASGKCSGLPPTNYALAATPSQRSVIELGITRAGILSSRMPAQRRRPTRRQSLQYPLAVFERRQRTRRLAGRAHDGLPGSLDGRPAGDFRIHRGCQSMAAKRWRMALRRKATEFAARKR